ncbi:hypothetical protein, partial [Thalassovita aquimarina]
KRTRLRRGYVTVVGRDGLIVTKPRRMRRRFPVRGIMLLALGFMGFKALLMAHLGFGIYLDRVENLQKGGMVEQAGAVLMAPEPVSQLLAVQLRPYLK